MIQPGQTDNTIGMAVGYGRTKGGRVANNIGFNGEFQSINTF